MQKALLLCYPDDFEESGASLAARCLEHLQADTLVHCGELFGDCPMLDKAPWGRTSAPEFQQHLFSLFRCGPTPDLGVADYFYSVSYAFLNVPACI